MSWCRINQVRASSALKSFWSVLGESDIYDNNSSTQYCLLPYSSFLSLTRTNINEKIDGALEKIQSVSLAKQRRPSSPFRVPICDERSSESSPALRYSDRNLLAGPVHPWYLGPTTPYATMYSNTGRRWLDVMPASNNRSLEPGSSVIEHLHQRCRIPDSIPSPAFATENFQLIASLNIYPNLHTWICRLYASTSTYNCRCYPSICLQ
jgi:hypothetical protein